MASQPMAPQAISRNMALASAARIELPRSPKVKRLSGALRASIAPPQASTRPSTSDRLCPASAINAEDWARKPYTNSTAVNPRFRVMAITKARPKSFGAPCG